MSEILLKQILAEVSEIRMELQDFKSQTNSRFDNLDATISIMQVNMNELKDDVSGIKATLLSVEEKIEFQKYETIVLNQRLFKTETKLEQATN